jgi:plasmid stability protein
MEALQTPGEPDMSTLVVKNLPDHLHVRLKAQARQNRRSLNQETVSVIEQALIAPRVAVKLAPPIKLKGGPLTIRDIEAAIAGGRD